MKAKLLSRRSRSRKLRSWISSDLFDVWPLTQIIRKVLLEESCLEVWRDNLLWTRKVSLSSEITENRVVWDDWDDTPFRGRADLCNRLARSECSLGQRRCTSIVYGAKIRALKYGTFHLINKLPSLKDQQMPRGRICINVDLSGETIKLS